MSNDGHDETGGEPNPGEAVGEIAEGVGGLAEGIGEAAEGDGLGAVGGVADGLGSLASGVGSMLPADSEAAEALNTAGSVVETGSQLLNAGRSLAGAGQSGDIGRAASGLGSLGGAADSARHIVPDNQVQDVLGAAGQVGSAVQQGGQMLDQLGNALGGAHTDDVEFHVEVAGADGQWGLNTVTLSEALNTVSTCVIESLYSESITPRDLLHKEVTLTMERQQQRRAFKGIVWHASVHDSVRGTIVQLHVRPAAALLAKQFDSRIFQQKSVTQIIEEVYTELLGSLHRSVRNDTERSYETREYTVQYQESSLDFITRLAEEEGIFWYFDYEEEHEILVLVDTTSGLPQARADNDGQVNYHAGAANASDGEAAWEISHFEEIGTTDAVVSDYDWTNPPLDVLGEETGRSEEEPALELHDHTDALVLHRYNGRQYQANTATIQARLRAEQLDLARQSWEMSTSVVTAGPGLLLELVGAPDGDLDQQYLIVAASSRGTARESARGSWENRLEVAPASMPYRPARRTPKPVVHGPETARVVGPSGEEIHTDEHGRVRVHFHWDRGHARDAEDSSCWLRVAHNWAGPGFGTFFLPRIGMEVVVSFLGGNPDRPLVTGCIYNGDNASPASPLPDNKTQSVVRTKSSTNSEGYNELRFEDKAGSEFIFIHAEKDFNEVVEHNHSTHVKNNQTNTVDVNQTELVGGEQKMTVKKDRFKTIEQSEFTEITLNRTETVDGSEDVFINADRSHSIKKDDSLLVEKGKRSIVVQTGKDEETYKGGRQTEVSKFDNLNVVDGANRNVHVSGQHNMTVDGHYALNQGGTEKLYLHGRGYWESAEKIQQIVPGVELEMKAGGEVTLKADAKISLSVGGTTLELTPDGAVIASPTIELQAGGGAAVTLGPSATLVKGAKVDVMADMFVTVQGVLVRIN